MKKFVGLTLAAVCTLTACAFGFSGCSKASDVVTEEEWIAAMSSEKAINVTMKATASASFKITYGSETESASYSSTLEAKTALSKIDSESPSVAGNVTGNTYYYEYDKEEESGTSYEDTTTCYASCTAEALTFVYKYTQTEYEDDWYGGQDVAYAITYNEAYAYCLIEGVMADFATEFDDFEYVNGVYKATDSYDDGYEYYVKINDGYLTSIEVKSEYTESSDGYSYYRSYNFKYEFSNYGTTTVSIPEEYTYEYYLANHS